MSRTQLETHSQQQLKHKIHRLTKEAPLISNKRRSTKRLLILTLTVVLSVTALAVAGWHYGQSAWLGLLGLWPMLKSSLTAKSLWALLKKTPWLLLIGVKKYAMKLVAMVIGTRVSARNPWVRDKIAYGQALVQEKTALLTARWSSLNFIERALLIVISVHLVLAVLLIMLLSKSLQIFALKSGSEKTAEQLVKHSIPQSLVDRVTQIDGEESSAVEDNDGLETPTQQPEQSPQSSKGGKAAK